MASRPFWWWLWLGWFPLFWFYPSYISAPIKTRTKNGDYSYSYYSGVGSIVSWVFFVLFLILFLSATVDSTLYIVYEIIWILFLVFIIIFWFVGIGSIVTFQGEFTEDQKELEKDAKDKSDVEGGEKVETEDLQPMRMRSSKQMKSLNMQL
tara:strand:+ start:113 stop:565 length:453 start_codon:yes stop_codon:yes gene_type:complete